MSFDPVTTPDPALTADAFHDFLLGELLGSGMSRDVYVYLPDDTKVVKIERVAGNFQNTMELHTWAAAQEEEHRLKDHLAQVYHISAGGRWLLMERTYRPGPNYKWPAKMPAALTDFKRANYGLTSAGKLVCHDYGTNLLLYHGMSARQHKADWWDV